MQASNLVDIYLKYTTNSEPSIQYRLAAILSLIGACLRRNVYLTWDKKLYPSLYVVLVGPSGARKGTAMGPVQDIVLDLPIASAAQKITPASLIRDLKSAEFSPPVTLSNINASPSASLYVVSSEFVVFIGDQNRDMIDILCDLWDNPPVWKYSTKNQGKDDISQPCLNIFGGITPDLLRKYLPPTAIGGGFTSRLLAVYSGSKEKSIFFPAPRNEEQILREELINGLTKMCALSGEFQVSDDFREDWPAWYMNSDKHIFYENTYLNHYADRRPTHVLKLAMIVSAMRNRESDSLLITAADLKKANDYLVLLERGMTKVYAGLGRNELADVTQRIMLKISILKVVRFGTLLNHFYGDVNKEELLKILSTLETMSWVHKIEPKPRLEDVEIRFKQT